MHRSDTKTGFRWARGSEPWRERRQGWKMALVVPAGVAGCGVGGLPGAAGKDWWSGAGC
jgi:hypothetical protein